METLEVNYRARPFKIATINRKFKGIVVTNLRDLKEKSIQSLDIGDVSQNIMVMLAEDDTLIDNEEYFATLHDNTKLIICTDEESLTQESLTSVPRRIHHDTGGDFVDAGSHEHMESQEISNHVSDIPQNLYNKLTSSNPSECVMAFLTMSNEELEFLSSCDQDTLAQDLSVENDIITVYIDNANRELLRRRELTEATQLLYMFERAKKLDRVDGAKRKKPQTS